MADDGVLEGGVERVGPGFWVSADAGDDEGGGGEGAGDSSGVANVAFGNGEVGGEGGLGDLAVEEEGAELGR